jgi:hypothetical protein
VVTSTVSVPAGSRRTVDVNPLLGAVVGHSTQVVSDEPILAERPMYFARAVSDDDVVINGGHVAFGGTPSASFHFAEGTVLPGFATYLTLANPGNVDAPVTIAYVFGDGTSTTKSVSVAGGSRRTVRVFDAADPAGVGRDVADAMSRGVSMQVTTTSPTGIVAERPMYFHRAIVAAGPEINDGHDVVGATSLAPAWSFAEGSTLDGFLPFLTISNPGAAAAAVTVTYTPDAGAPVVRTLTAPAGSRTTVQVYGPAEQGGIGGAVSGFGIFVASSAPVLVERPLYVDRVIPGLPEINGGSVVVGSPG